MICFSAIILLVAVLLSGVAVQKLLKLPFSFTNAVMVGFLTLLAVFQVIAYPMMRLNTSFTLLFWVYSGVLLLFILSGLSASVTRPQFFRIRSHIRAVWSNIHRELPMVLLALGMAAAALLLSCCFSFDTSDDSYYLPRVMEILSQNRLDFPQGFIWSGISNTSMPENVDASTLELWKAYWSHLFGMHPTIFSRNTLTVVIHFVSWCSLYQAFRSVSRHSDTLISGLVFLFVYLMLLLLDNQHSDVPFWIIRFPSQGKSILLSIIYPAIIYGCAGIVELGRKPIPWTRWGILSIVFTAGIASSIIGVFWPFLCCLSMGLPYLIIDRRKEIPKLILPLVLTCLPVIIYAGLAYFSVVTEQTRYLAMEKPSWSGSFTGAVNIHILDLFLFCLAYIFLSGSRKAKLILLGGTIALFAGILNPLFTPFVSKYLSTGNVYFRLFWMIPIYFSIAYSVAEAFSGCSVKCRQLVVGLTAAAVLFVAGVGVLRSSPADFCMAVNYRLGIVTNAEAKTNPYGLRSFWCSMGQAMLDQAEPDGSVRIIWLSEKDCFLRQYSHRIEILGACRDTQRQYFDQPVGDCTVSPLEIAQQFDLCNKADFDEPQWAAHQLTLSGVDFVCVDSSSGFAQRGSVPSGFELFGQFGDYTVYRIVPSGR